MKLAFSLLIILALSGCNEHKSLVEPFSIKELHPGLTQLDIYRINEKDTSYDNPPPPPMKETLTFNNIIEAKDGRVYYYSFPAKLLCGYMMEGNPAEWGLHDLDTMTVAGLHLVDSASINKVIQEISGNSIQNRSVPLIIGIQGVSSENKVLLQLINTFYKNIPKAVWKVRELNNKEKQLLNALKAQ